MYLEHTSGHTYREKVNIKYLVLFLIFLFYIFLFHHACIYEAEAYAAIDNYEQYLKVKNVLVIHSYHPSFKWTYDINQGIVSTINNSGYNINIYIEYMDWKNYPKPENVDLFTEMIKLKYGNKPIDLIITSDDAALEFAIKNRNSILPYVPIVFCGVDMEGVGRIIGNNRHKITGVIENIHAYETIKIAKTINPSVDTVYIVHDSTESGKSGGNIARKQILELFPDMKIIQTDKMTPEEIALKLEIADKNNIAMITSYHKDPNGRSFNTELLAAYLSSKSAVPVYHLYDVGIGKGVLGGNVESAKTTGSKVAQMALLVLTGEGIDNIDYIIDQTDRNIFDYSQLMRFNISKSVLPKNSIIINRPFSFFETYRTLVIVVAIFLAVLLLLIGYLAFVNAQLRKTQLQLRLGNEELVQLYEELTASEEELRQQFDELMYNKRQLIYREEELKHMAYHDSLTGLPNRASLQQDMDTIIQVCPNMIAVMFIDIDNFKYINDTLGHVYGDQLIAMVGQRIEKIVSSTGRLYRLGGDEFVVMMRGVHDIEQVEFVIDRIIRKFKEPFEAGQSKIYCTLSAGIAIYPNDASSTEELLINADIAMYKAKEKGKNTYVLYDKSMNDEMVYRARMERHLCDALENGEFYLVFQPQYSLKTLEIEGFEALVRWHSPILGNVPPSEFIKIAEDSRLIVNLGQWILAKACDFVRRLRQYGNKDIFISVNISIIELMQEDFVNNVLRTIQDAQIPESSIELEITESILTDSFDHLNSKLEYLRKKGVRIALDDFGTGYSSLNYLKRLEIDTLKIDKSFIDDISDTNENETLAASIIRIGHSMKLDVVAEGIENARQADYLARYGCDKVQGYYFCKPLSEEQVIKILQQKE